MLFPEATIHVLLSFFIVASAHSFDQGHDSHDLFHRHYYSSKRISQEVLPFAGDLGQDFSHNGQQQRDGYEYLNYQNRYLKQNKHPVLLARGRAAPMRPPPPAARPPPAVRKGPIPAATGNKGVNFGKSASLSRIQGGQTRNKPGSNSGGLGQQAAGEPKLRSIYNILPASAQQKQQAAAKLQPSTAAKGAKLAAGHLPDNTRPAAAAKSPAASPGAQSQGSSPGKQIGETIGGAAPATALSAAALAASIRNGNIAAQGTNIAQQALDVQRETAGLGNTGSGNGASRGSGGSANSGTPRPGSGTSNQGTTTQGNTNRGSANPGTTNPGNTRPGTSTPGNAEPASQNNAARPGGASGAQSGSRAGSRGGQSNIGSSTSETQANINQAQSQGRTGTGAADNSGSNSAEHETGSTTSGTSYQSANSDFSGSGSGASEAGNVPGKGSAGSSATNGKTGTTNAQPKTGGDVPGKGSGGSNMNNAQNGASSSQQTGGGATGSNDASTLQALDTASAQQAPIGINPSVQNINNLPGKTTTPLRRRKLLRARKSWEYVH